MASFKNILIPVDLTENTHAAISKAIELPLGGSTIHLLYVQDYSMPGLTGALQRYLVEAQEMPGYLQVVEKMNKWKKMLMQHDNTITVIPRIIQNSSVQSEIERTAVELNADLIIIGKRNHHSWLPFINTVSPKKIVRKTGITVLTVKPGYDDGKMKTVVVPLTEHFQHNKMDAILYICASSKIKVHLIAFTDDISSKDTKPTTFLQMYQWLRTCIHCPVEYTVLPGYNKARAILKYAEAIHADILLVHQGKETKLGWPDKHITDVLAPDSKMQVWSLQRSAS